MYHLVTYLLTSILISSMNVMTIHSSDYWKFQESIKIQDTGGTYGLSPSVIFGRGIMTLITGYDTNETAGIYVHSTGGDGVMNKNNWHLRTKITSEKIQVKSKFGHQIYYMNTTVLVSAPNQDHESYSNVGAIYIFNGSEANWTLIQTLRPPVIIANNYFFGNVMKISGTQMIVASASESDGMGAAYIFQQDTNYLTWSLVTKLLPQDTVDSYFGFGHAADIYNNVAVVGAMNDEESGKHSGSVFIFTSTGNSWVQSQWIYSTDAETYQPGRINGHKGTKFFGSGLSIAYNYSIAVAVNFTSNETIPSSNVNEYTIYIYNNNDYVWSVGQRLFKKNETDRFYNVQLVYSEAENYPTLFAQVSNGSNSFCYVFVFDNSNSWNFQQRISYPKENLIKYNASSDLSTVNETVFQNDKRLFSNPSSWGGYLLFHGNDEVLIFSKLKDNSCLLLSLTDHFDDSWDIATISVIAPDTSIDSFQPPCRNTESASNPYDFGNSSYGDGLDLASYRIRYCPNQRSDEGIYIIKVYSPLNAKFFWEISWRLYLNYKLSNENNSRNHELPYELFYGDYSTKILVYFNSTTAQFSYYSSENLDVVVADDLTQQNAVYQLSVLGVNVESKLQTKCSTCNAITTQSWETLQTIGWSSFFPFDVTGASYFISTIDASSLVFFGRVCPNRNGELSLEDRHKTYQCYQMLYDGYYILRLGNGIFDSLHYHYPISSRTNVTVFTEEAQSQATWSGCGESGGLNDEFVFQILNGECIPIQKYTYLSKCTNVEESTTPLPTSSPSTSSAFLTTVLAEFNQSYTSNDTVKSETSMSQTKLSNHFDGF